MLKHRVITALALLPFVGLALFYLNLTAFAAVVAVLAGLLAWEWARLMGWESAGLRLGYATSTFAIVAIIWSFSPELWFWPHLPNSSAMYLQQYWLLASVVFFAIALMLIITFPRSGALWRGNPYVRGVMGWIVIPATWVALVSIRSMQALQDHYYGSLVLLYMLLIIWGADVGAYAAGKTLGRHKLAPNVSPGKTWEGFFGGLLVAVAIAVGGVFVLSLRVNNWTLFTVFAVLLVIISVTGDLLESMFKRVVGIKDSSQILPGHGGLLDRLDSTMAVAPLFVLGFLWLELS